MQKSFLLFIFIWLIPSVFAGTLKLQEQIRVSGSSFGTSKVTISPEGNDYALLSDWGGTVAAVNLQTKETLWSLFTDTSSHMGKGVLSILQNRGQFLATHDVVCNITAPLSLHDIRTGKLIRNFEYDTSLQKIRLESLSLSPDLRFAIAGGSYEKVAVEPRPDCNMYGSSASLPAPVFIFNMESGKLIGKTKTGLRHVFKAAFSSDQKFIYAIGESGFKAWSMPEGNEIKEIHLAEFLGPEYKNCDVFAGCGPNKIGILAAEIQSGLRFAAMATYNQVFVINLESHKIISRIKLPDAHYVRAIHFSADKLLVLASQSYGNRSKAILFSHEPSTGEAKERFDGAEIEPATGGTPFNPSATVHFFASSPTILIGNMPAAHVPLPITFMLLKYEH